MKKSIITILILTLLLNSMTVFAGSNNRFFDTEKHWAKDHIYQLVDMEAIDGYPDGSFRADDSITVAEFTKIFISLVNLDVIKETEGTHWAQKYIDAAISKNYILIGEFNTSDYDRPILRQEMARMIGRVFDDTHTNTDYKRNIKDFSTINATYQNHVLKVFSLGIICGYPDGTFKAIQKATRGEACKMLHVMLDAQAGNINKPEVAPEKPASKYKTVDDLGYKAQPVSNFGETFNFSDDRYDQVVIIKKTDLPVQVSSRLVVHDIRFSQDKQYTIVTQELLSGDTKSYLHYGIIGERIRSRSPIAYYEKSLGNNIYETTHKVATKIEEDYKTFTTDKIDYFIFTDYENSRFIAIEK